MFDLRKILQMMGIYFVMSSQYSFYEANPLTGDDVRIADLGELPFIVSLSFTTCGHIEKAELSHFCGGALITKDHVLTAAHCLRNKSFKSVVVKIGSIDLRNANTHRVREWVTYSEWSGIQVPEGYDADYVYDIAVIKLLDAVNLDFKLPTISYIPDKDLYGLSAITGGWGLLEENKRAKNMRIAKFFIKPPEKCKAFIKQKDAFLQRVWQTTNLCTSAVPFAAVMPGDSGSPLLRDENNIVGVNSKVCVFKSYTMLCHHENLHSSVNAYAKFIEEMKQL